MAVSSGNSTKKKRGNPENLIPWKPGQSGNPQGRKFGQRNRKTVIMDAIRRIAEAKDADPIEIEDAIQAVGIAKALKGSFFHFQTISDGLYGKITDKLEHSVEGKTLFELIAAAHARRTKRTADKKPRAGKRSGS